jgi:hypothetical protein
MSLYKITVGVVAVMVGAAAVTALAGTSPAAKIGSATPAAQVDVQPVSACPQAPWPYGCQWQEPVRRVQRSTRSF